ncbi:MAG: signal peptidase I [Actinomycetota bacterium]|nr:signal peptidase I [Actinomycetota bacterium]
MAEPLSTTETPATKKGSRVALEWVVIVVAAIVIAVVVRSFLFQPFYIPSGSMEPTLKVGDRLLVNKLSYDVHGVHRGDIVVFARPPNDPSPGIKDLIKRVVGLPGETLQGKAGAVYINGHPLAEPYLPHGRADYASPDSFPAAFPPTIIPPGDYFMMGDNRANSEDSRYFGPVPEKLFVGRAFFRVWPLSNIGTP